jgi:hypothetical protein
MPLSRKIEPRRGNLDDQNLPLARGHTYHPAAGLLLREYYPGKSRIHQTDNFYDR